MNNLMSIEEYMEARSKELSSPKLTPVVGQRMSEEVYERQLQRVKVTLEAGLVRCAAFPMAVVERAEQYMDDDVRWAKIGLDASAQVLDRVLGKAAQVVQVDDVRARPIIFDAKLEAMADGVRAAQKVFEAGKDAKEVMDTFDSTIEWHGVENDRPIRIVE